jgi:hypothetical protein
MEKMKARWGVGPWGVIAILIAFSLAGMTVVRLKAPVMGFILPEDSPGWLTWVVYLLVVFPIYQVCLLAYGTPPRLALILPLLDTVIALLLARFSFGHHTCLHVEPTGVSNTAASRAVRPAYGQLDVKKSKTLPSLLLGERYISVYVQRVHVTVVKRLVWTSKSLLRIPPVARNSLRSH